MKLSDADWVLSLIQATKEGKTIQVRSPITSNKWLDVEPEDNRWYAQKENYRIKPEPKVHYKVLFERVLETSVRLGGHYTDEEEAKNCLYNCERLPSCHRAWIEKYTQDLDYKGPQC